MLLASPILLLPVQAQLEVLPPSEPQRVFSGGKRNISVVVTNRSEELVDNEVVFRLYQTTSATAVPVGDAAGKRFKLLPRQKVIESVQVNFPQVRAETRFAVQWIEATNQVIGTTPVLAYPRNLLEELHALVGEEGILGVFDPIQQLKPILGEVGVEFQDLEETGIASFQGRLAILGPFDSKGDMPGDLARRVRELAGKGVATVWMQPPSGPHGKVRPSFETVPIGVGTVILAQHNFIANLADDPQSQLNLIHCGRLALHPESPHLPVDK